MLQTRREKAVLAQFEVIFQPQNGSSAEKTIIPRWLTERWAIWCFVRSLYVTHENINHCCTFLFIPKIVAGQLRASLFSQATETTILGCASAGLSFRERNEGMFGELLCVLQL